MTSTRDSRNYSKGYQAAMKDIADALLRGGEDEVREWLKNNTIERKAQK